MMPGALKMFWMAALLVPPATALSAEPPPEAPAAPAARAAVQPVDPQGAKREAPEREVQDRGPGPAVSTDRLRLDTTVVTGNRELPKVLYIVPWKKADIGELPAQPFNTLLDEVLQPVDRDVFRREVTYYDALSSDGGTARGAAAGGAGAAARDPGAAARDPGAAARDTEK